MLSWSQLLILVSVSCSVMNNSLRPHGLQSTRLLCPWDFPGKDTGVGCHFLLQEVFPTQGLNPGLLHCRHILYWLSYKGSPKNIINLILVLTIWWCPCVESYVVGRGCLLWPVRSLGKTLLAFALLHSVLQGQICLLLQVFLDFLLLHSSPL